MSAPEQPYLGFYPDAELVLALVCPVGADHSRITDTIQNRLRQFGYETNSIRLSDWFPVLFESLGMAWVPPGEPRELALYMMDAGNRIRKETGSVRSVRSTRLRPHPGLACAVAELRGGWQTSSSSYGTRRLDSQTGGGGRDSSPSIRTGLFSGRCRTFQIGKRPLFQRTWILA